MSQVNKSTSTEPICYWTNYQWETIILSE